MNYNGHFVVYSSLSPVRVVVVKRFSVLDFESVDLIHLLEYLPSYAEHCLVKIFNRRLTSVCRAVYGMWLLTYASAAQSQISDESQMDGRLDSLPIHKCYPSQVLYTHH